MGDQGPEQRTRRISVTNVREDSDGITRYGGEGNDDSPRFVELSGEKLEQFEAQEQKDHEKLVALLGGMTEEEARAELSTHTLQEIVDQYAG